MAAGCKNLIEISLPSHCKDRAIGALTSCQQLETIVMDFCPVSDLGLSALTAGCQRLRTVRLAVTPVGDTGLQELALNCGPHLVELDLKKCLALTDSGVAMVVRLCHRLETLQLQDTSVSDVTLQAIFTHGKCLRSLDLNHTRITDGGFRAANQSCCKHLRLLKIQGTACSEMCLREVLAHLKSVKRVEIWGLSLSRPAIISSLLARSNGRGGREVLSQRLAIDFLFDVPSTNQ